MKDMDYCKNFICLRKPPAGVKSYEIIQTGNGSSVCVETDDDISRAHVHLGTTERKACFSHPLKLFFIGLGNALTYNEGYSSVYLSPHHVYHSGTLFFCRSHATSLPVRCSCPWISSPSSILSPWLTRNVLEDGIPFPHGQISLVLLNQAS